MIGGYGLFLWLPILIAQTIAQENKLPHIILIVADDLGWNDVGVHGSRLAPTPNIDALAAAGRLLRQHYALPTCTPSRAALLTGRHAAATGMQGYPLRAGEPRGLPLQTTTLPQSLKERGYVTRLLGKWHLGAHLSEYLPTSRGFDSHLGYRNGYVGYFDHSLGQTLEPGKVMEGFDLWRDDGPAFDTKGRYLTHAITQEATRVIRFHAREAVGNAPLFLQVSHLAVHTGNVSTPMEVPDPETTHKRFSYEPDPNRRLYAGMLSELDESVGEVLEALRDTNMLHNSIVIFISDNGGMSVGLHCNYGSNWPLRGTKHTLFEGGVHTVGAIWSPLLPRRTPYSNLLHISDWAPTLLSAVDNVLHISHRIRTERRQEADLMEGISHWEALTAKEEDIVLPPRDDMLLNVDDVIGHSGIRVGRWKYVEGFHENGSQDGHVGAPSRGDDYPAYDAEATARAARRLGLDAALSAGDVLSTQESAKISCNGLQDELGSPACPNACLFDLEQDPCEMRDLSLVHPEMLHSLRARLQALRERSAEQLNQPVDPQADPSLHGGVWAPWLDGQETDGKGDHGISDCSTIDDDRGCFNDGEGKGVAIQRRLYNDDGDGYSGGEGETNRDKSGDLGSGRIRGLEEEYSQVPSEGIRSNHSKNTEEQKYSKILATYNTERNEIGEDFPLNDSQVTKQRNSSNNLIPIKGVVFPFMTFILIYLAQ